MQRFRADAHRSQGKGTLCYIQIKVAQVRVAGFSGA